MGTPEGSVAACFNPQISKYPAAGPGKRARTPISARLGRGARAWLYGPVRSRLFAGLIGASCLLAACGGGGGVGGSKAGPTTTAKGKASDLSAETASFDMAVGPPSRYLIGLFTNDQRGVSYGSIELRFCFLGATKAAGPCQLSAPSTATFLPTPGTTVAPDKTAPEVVSPSGPKGVYVAQAAFDKAGIWQTHVTATVGGQQRQAETSFQVLERHAIASVGDAALPSENLTVSTPGASPAAIDSRAGAGGLVPDPELHQKTIAAAIAAHRPVLVVFST